MNAMSVALPLLGGALIGLAAALMLLLNGRIAGISGITAGLLRPNAADTTWRLMFVFGLLLAGLLLAVLLPGALPESVPRSLPAVAAAGLLVGFGVRLGSGCTSGHGVCGVARLSPRSWVATLTFIASGAVTVTVIRTVFGGAL